MPQLVPASSRRPRPADGHDARVAAGRPERGLRSASPRAGSPLARRQQNAPRPARPGSQDAPSGPEAPLGRLDEITVRRLSDSYKESHYLQYPPKTEKVYSYFESRTKATFPTTLFFGLQGILKRHLVRGVTPADIAEGAACLPLHMPNCPANQAGWQHIIEHHGGRLPVSIRAVPEGTRVPTGNVLMTVENTDPACYWLTNYLESLLLQVWYPCTVATQSRAMKETIGTYLERTTGSRAGLDLKLHDFGFRGAPSPDAAGIGGGAHLVNFRGTDNMAAITYLRNYYDAPMAGFSIPAAEHSTITSWGEAREEDAYRNMLRYDGPVSVVSDSYDLFGACEHLWGGSLRDEVAGRDAPLVIRPDSGDPKTVLPALHDLLAAKFGSTTEVVDGRPYRRLPPQIAILQGDGIDRDSLGPILESVAAAGWSTASLALGSGGGLLQKVNRDTQRFAFKCSAARIDGDWTDVFKRPATDPSKASKRGRLKLVHDENGFRTVGLHAPGEDQLVEVFRDGELLVDDDLETIRARAERPLDRATASPPAR